MGDENILPPHKVPPVLCPDLPTELCLTTLTPDNVFLLVTLAIIPWAPGKPAPVWLTTYKRPAPLSLISALPKIYGATSHEDLPSQHRMTLFITCPASVQESKDYSWWELVTACREHKSRSSGIPLAIDGTQIPEVDFRTYLGQWLGSVQPFTLQDNIDDRLPRRPPRPSLPQLAKLTDRLYVKETTDRQKASRAEGDDMAPCPSDRLCATYPGAHVPEEDVKGGDNY